MALSPEQIDQIKKYNEHILANFSIDCAVFGFHDSHLKILLNKLKGSNLWGLPGGFVQKDESLDDAAKRILMDRTGLTDIFLKQFMTFGGVNRNSKDVAEKIIEGLGASVSDFGWLMQRMVSVGYFALVNYSKAKPTPDMISEESKWWDLGEVPTLIYDHNEILSTALKTLQQNLLYKIVIFNLLPEKFTMTELRRLYETILGKAIDRRNFEKKMLKLGILSKTEEKKRDVTYKSPVLYKFNKVRYQKIKNESLGFGFNTEGE